MKLRISNCGFRIFHRTLFRGRLAEQSEIRNPKFKIAIAATILLVVMAWNTPADAKLVVFVDGRVLKVEDARLDGDRIVLELKGGGMLRVSAIRVDRVIADEIVEPAPSEFLDDSACPAAWADEDLPEGTPFRTAIAEAARNSDLHPWLVAAVVQTESAFDSNAVSRAGAAGLMQLMPSAAADREVRNVLDPAENLRGGTAHLRIMLDRFESLTLALAAYNAGATTVDRYDGVPPYAETRNYVRKVLELFCPGE
jgi:hypothetical protein